MPSIQAWGLGYYGEDETFPDESDAPRTSEARREWEALLSMVFPDAKLQVKRAVEAWNGKVREQLRNETGFRLSHGERQVSVSVSVADGLPDLLADVLSNDLARWGILLLHKREFLDAEAGAHLAASHLTEIAAFLRPNGLSKAEQTAIEGAAILLAELNAKLATLRVAEKILEINKDVLGAYFYRRRAVKLFWMPIALISISLQVPIDALVIVVLTHELSHAYTHLGFDIDGGDWETTEFAESPDELIEGLAQYYTQAVCENFQRQIPSALECFMELKRCQPYPYVNYVNWPQSDSSEHMRHHLRYMSGRMDSVSVEQGSRE